MPKEKSQKEKEEKKLDEELDRAEKVFIEREKKEKEAKKEKKAEEGYNPWKVLVYPHLAEKSMNMVELENKLVFIVNRNAKRSEIKEAIEKGFNVGVDHVNVEITMKGQKKAYIKLAPGYDAADIASRLGML